MQLTDDALNRINGHKIELKDNFIHLTLNDAMDPTANICAGTRWLFMKYAGARERFKKAKIDHPATWDDAVAEYKGILQGIIKGEDPDPKGEMPIFRDFYKKLLGS